MNGIEIRALTRSFNGKKALDNVNFQIPKGAVYGFIGPNGAGKTTVLRIMSGLDIPDKGDVLFDGISLIDYPEKISRQIGFMPDSLPNTKSIFVWEYLDFFARAFGYKGEEKKHKLDEISKLTRLNEIAEKRLSALSKGMKQRVTLARVLLQDPEYMLLDEPAAGLDPFARMELHNIITEIQKTGKTLFISSHILPELEALVNGVVIIEKGVIQYCGSLNELNRTTKTESQETVIPMLVGFSEKSETFLSQVQETGLFQTCEIHGKCFLKLGICGDAQKYNQAAAALFQMNLPIISVQRMDSGLEGAFRSYSKGDVQ